MLELWGWWGIQVIWDVMLCHWVVSDISRVRGAFILKGHPVLRLNCFPLGKQKHGDHSDHRELPYILESNPHPSYSFRGLKNQTWITFGCRLDSRSRTGFWKNDGAAVRAVRTIQYNNLLFYLLLIIIYYSSDSPSSLITESLSVLRGDCARLLQKTHFTVPVWMIGPRRSIGF